MAYFSSGINTLIVLLCGFAGVPMKKLFDTVTGINKGVEIDDMCVTAIAPLIAALLDIEFPSSDGKLVPNF